MPQQKALPCSRIQQVSSKTSFMAWPTVTAVALVSPPLFPSQIGIWQDTLLFQLLHCAVELLFTHTRCAAVTQLVTFG